MIDFEQQRLAFVAPRVHLRACTDVKLILARSYLRYRATLNLRIIVAIAGIPAVCPVGFGNTESVL